MIEQWPKMPRWPLGPEHDAQRALVWGLTLSQVRECRAMYEAELELAAEPRYNAATSTSRVPPLHRPKKPTEYGRRWR